MPSSEHTKSSSLLVVTLTPEMAGAERIVLQLLARLDDAFLCSLGFLRRASPDTGTIPWMGTKVGLGHILFGSYDIIHSHLFLPGLVVRMRRLWSKRFRWVHTVHYHDYSSLRFGRLKRWLDRVFIFPAADRLVAVSDTVLHSLPALPHSVVVENAIALDPVRVVDREVVDGHRPRPIIGTVAMFRPEKGIRELILAAEILRRRGLDFAVRIAGDGPLRPELEHLIQERDLGDHVELVGYLSELESFYNSLDIYLQPSVEEGFGLAVLDAMRFGLPIVASRVGNLPRLLGQGDFGLLVNRDAGFVESLADAVESVQRNPGGYREESRRGLEHWRERIDPGKMAERYTGIFRDLLRPGVCMISPIVTQSTGGLQRQLYLQSRELHRHGYDVFVLQREDPALTDDQLTEKWEHVRFLSTPDVLRGNPGPGQLPDRVRGLVFVFFGFLQLCRWRHRIALCHAHQLYSPTLVAVLAKLLLGKPVVVKVTASGSLGEMAELGRLPFSRLRKLSFRFIDRLIVLTPEMRKEMIEVGFREDRIDLIPNCVALPADTGETSSTRPDEPYQLLFCGRLSREKSLHTLIQAVDILTRQGRAVRLHLVGGPDPDRDVTDELRAEAGRLHEPSDVIFHGFQESPDRFLRSADAFVLPSQSEGLSNSLLEAISYGLVCVVSDIPQNRFVIEDGVNGLLFRQGSSEDLASRLESLIRDREERGGQMASRLSLAARDAAITRFSAAAIGHRLVDLYELILTS